jgi:four helix bundle protein
MVEKSHTVLKIFPWLLASLIYDSIRPLKNLEVYQLSRKLSSIAWKIFCQMSFEDKRHIGDPFLRSVDSVGAKIAEGYGRFYYLDKVRFYYNARGSHFEAFVHWLEVMSEREKISTEEFEYISGQASILLLTLNNFITVTTKKGRENHDKV